MVLWLVKKQKTDEMIQRLEQISQAFVQLYVFPTILSIAANPQIT